MTHRFALVVALSGTLAVGCGSDGGGGDDNIIPGLTGINGGGATASTGDDAGASSGTNGTAGTNGTSTTGTGTSTTGTSTTTTGVDGGCADTDDDGVCDDADACEGFDDALDADSDGVPDDCDVCEGDDTVDTDGDETPDACDEDDDDDTLEDGLDNCPLLANTEQTDTDGDEIGDVCDSDDDGDGFGDDVDNCPLVTNTEQTDTDGDGNGDPCDLCEGEDDFNASDMDDDGVPDACDVCEGSDDFLDTDEDGTPDGCDEDDDDDTVADEEDNCPLVANEEQDDLDGDGVGDVCDDDQDGDGVEEKDDNCPRVPNGAAEAEEEGVGNQSDLDEDGEGDACDADADGDEVDNDEDNCPYVANGEAQAEVEGVGDQTDSDMDDLGDACDDDDDNDGVPDADDRCPGGDDTLDADEDGVADDCDVCDGGDGQLGDDDSYDYDDDGTPDCDDPCGPGGEQVLNAAYWLRLGETSAEDAVLNEATGGAAGVYGDDVALGRAGPSEDLDGAAQLPGGDAAGSYVRLASASRMPDDALTLTLWVQLESDATPQTLLSYAVGSEGDALVVGLDDDAGDTVLSVTIAGNTWTTPIELDTRDWTHLAVSWDGADGALVAYVDGVVLDDGNLSSGETLGSSGRLVLGQAQSGGQGPDVGSDAPLTGLLDEVAIFGSVLDASAVADLAGAFGEANGCAVLPRTCNDVLGTALDQGDGVYRLYPNGSAVELECDMTTADGGWTLCGRIDTTDCVEESDTYVDADDLQNDSFCVALFTDAAPDALMVLNRSSEGSGERVVIDWSAAPIAIGDYEAETEVECTFYDASGTADASRYDECAYVSHEDESFVLLDYNWQNAAWSFADGLGNEYSDGESARVLLGPTFLECADDENWRNFAGRDEPTAGDLYLR